MSLKKTATCFASPQRVAADPPIWLMFAQAGVNAFQKMGLAGPDGTVQDQRINALARRFDQAERRGMGDPVTGADDEIGQAQPTASSFTAARMAARSRSASPLGWNQLTDFTRAVGGWILGAFNFRLGLPCRLKQLGVNRVANLHGAAQHLVGGGAHGFGKGILQPLLIEVVRNAYHKMVVLADKFGIAGKPEIIAWLPDPLSNRLAQRSHDFALAGSQWIPPVRNAGAKVFVRKRQKVRSQEGRPASDGNSRRWQGL